MKKTLLIILILIAWLPSFGNELVLKQPPVIGSLPSLGQLHLGGFSGLTLQHRKGKPSRLFTITDRGPNTKAFDFNRDGIKDRGFFLPNFTPEIVEIKLEGGKVVILNRLPLAYAKKDMALGLPNQGLKDNPNYFDEKPFLFNKSPLNYNLRGIDPEGIAIDQNGFFWIVEEYGPSILKVNSRGNILKRFIPRTKNNKRYGTQSLPAFLAKRKLNRGFEGVSIIGDKLYCILQSPLKIGNWKKEGITHILEFDISQERVTGHYLYQLESEGRKIGGMTPYKGKLAVIEQNGKLGNKSFKKLYQVNLSASSNILNAKLTKFTKNELSKNRIITATKTEILDFNKFGMAKFEKIEGITALDNEKLFLAIDNDFGISESYDLIKQIPTKHKPQSESYFFKVTL